MTNTLTKLELRGERIALVSDQASVIIIDIFNRLGCPHDISRAITEHFIDANLSGVESHGVMRVMQYAERMLNGTMRVDVRPKVITTKTGMTEVDGGMGCGIPARHLAFKTSMVLAEDSGLAALSILNTGHTGRHGAFAEDAAEKGFLTICMGGGNHRVHSQVAPHGGARGHASNQSLVYWHPGWGPGTSGDGFRYRQDSRRLDLRSPVCQCTSP